MTIPHSERARQIAEDATTMTAIEDKARTPIELADRVEALSGPCRETDALIAVALPRGDWWDDCMGEPGYEAKRFTESMDAAMTLVPDRFFPGVSQNVHHSNWFAWMGDIDGDGPLTRGEAHAWSPALALTAASLRALASQVEGLK